MNSCVNKYDEITPRINPVIKEEWIDALRSGKYVQGYDKLRDENNHFCCLGVLEDICIPKTKNKWYYDKYKLCYWINRSPVQTLHETTINLVGACSCVIMIKDLTDRYSCYTSLVDLNDSKEFTFEQIADIIEYFL